MTTVLNNPRFRQSITVTVCPLVSPEFPVDSDPPSGTFCQQHL
jgi:hypothetical protein